jgi:LmbE family N-acetylglucosaminyl deacetylase
MNSVICFGAHPDDIEIGSAGILKKHFVNKYDVNFMILTNGENGFKVGSESKEQRIKIRKNEQLAVAKNLGIKEVFFLDYKDGFLEYTENLRQSIVQIIKQLRPEIIFSFDPANQKFDDLNLYHRDHRVAAQVVFDACFAAKNAWMYPGEPYTVSKIYFYGSDTPNHYEDVSDLMEFKLSLIALHQSQFPDKSVLERLLKHKVSPKYKDYSHAERFRILNVAQKQY